MKSWMPILALAAAVAAPSALAQSISGAKPQTTILCVDVSGRSVPPACKVQASRLDNSEDICLCHTGMPLVTPVCPPGVKPPAESLALERARRAYIHAGSLMGVSFEGKPMCVVARNSPDR
jgi:hypothetical protein